MRSLHFAGLLALALAACEPKGLQITDANTPPAPGATSDATPVDVSGCSVRVEKAWIEQETPLRRYTSEAQTIGPTCQQAVAVLIIRAREGSPIYTWSSRTQDLMGLYDVSDTAAMKTALADWIDQSGAMLKTTADLPEWEETDGQPKRSEFPFMPESWIDKAGWDQLRRDKLDMFCFVQGRESMNCAVLRDGQMEEIGVQLFPG
jgi:hypothetical protein